MDLGSIHACVSACGARNGERGSQRGAARGTDLHFTRLHVHALVMHCLSTMQWRHTVRAHVPLAVALSDPGAYMLWRPTVMYWNSINRNTY